MSSYNQLDQTSADAIRVLTLDAVQTANSGHPGMPLGMADVAYVLYKHFLKADPSAHDWFNRDRFVGMRARSFTPSFISPATASPSTTSRHSASGAHSPLDTQSSA